MGLTDIANLFQRPTFQPASAGSANPFQVQRPAATPAVRFGGELQEVAARGSAFSPDGGIGREIAGGFHVLGSDGQYQHAGKRLQVFG